MSNSSKHLIEFGEYCFDASARLLTRQGQTVSLTPKALDLLAVLVQQPGQLLDKETLLQAVWPDSFVEENNLADNIFKLRKALGEGYIETAPKRGYRFVGEVRRATAPVAVAVPQEVEPPSGSTPSEPMRVAGGRLPWMVAGLAVGVALGLGFALLRVREPAPLPSIRAALLPPAHASFGEVAVSPDGRTLAFTAITDKLVRLWLRPLASDAARPVDGTEGATYPFWSPDSRSVGFFAGGKLKKVDVGGGRPITLGSANSGTGATWNQAGDILFTTLGDPRIWRVTGTGGAASEVLRAAPGQTDVSEPSFLPDGRTFLYLALSGDPRLRGIYLGSLDGSAPERILEHDSNAVFAAGDSTHPDRGYLLFGREGALVAQPFQTSTRRISGEAVTIAPRLGVVPGGQISYRRRNFSVSASGLLVLDPNPGRQRSQMQWVDRRGNVLGVVPELDEVTAPLLSPDETRVAVARKDLATNNNDIWLAGLDSTSPVRFTFDPASDILGVWSPGGDRIAWASTRNGVFDLFEKEVNGRGQDTVLLRSGVHKFPLDYSADGRYLLFRQIDPQTRHDIHVLPLTGDRKPYPYLKSTAMENGGVFSPDGRWIAYASDESGRFEVYVESFPSHGGRRQVSIAGGSAPRWRADGGELYFVTADGQLMAAPVRSGATLATGELEALFRSRFVGTSMIASYAPTRSGQRFLVCVIADVEPHAPLSLVSNWIASIR